MSVLVPTSMDLQPPPRGVQPLLLVAGLVVAIAAVLDFSTDGVNLSICYLLAMVIAMPALRRGIPWGVAAGLIVLSLAGYFLGAKAYAYATFSDYFSIRLLNRGLVCMEIILITLMSRETRYLGEAEQLMTQGGDEAESGEGTLFGLQLLLIAVLSVVLVVVLLILDVILPRDVNVAILYAVPILLTSWTRSRRLLWTVALSAVVVGYVAYFVGPAETAPPVWVSHLVSRTIAVGVALAIALTIDYRWSQRARRAGPGTPGTAAPSAP